MDGWYRWSNRKNDQNRYRYEKHTLGRIYYETLEEQQDFADENNSRTFDFLKFLEQVGNGSVKPEQLQLKM